MCINVEPFRIFDLLAYILGMAFCIITLAIIITFFIHKVQHERNIIVMIYLIISGPFFFIFCITLGFLIFKLCLLLKRQYFNESN